MRPARLHPVLIWLVLGCALSIPMGIAATSSLLAWRDPVYVAAGFAGVLAMTLLVVQPLLAGGYLPGLHARSSRRLHVLVGIGLVVAVVTHVAGLWLTSPPDVVDALLLRSPTSFSIWGVLAMWAVFAAAFLAAVRRRWRIPPRRWRLAHTAFAILIVIASVVHAMLIDGTMGVISKAMLCAATLAVMAKVLADRWGRS